MGSQSIDRHNAKASALNRAFYDLAADVYEQADGRRKKIPVWLEDQISYSELNRDECLFDLGAGTGYASKIANKYYQRVYAFDVSREMLSKIKDRSIIKVVCDITQDLPVPELADKIIAISTLHHIHDLAGLLKVIDRNLSNGGIFYSDYDLDNTFARVWKLPLMFYRKIRKAGKRYETLNPAALADLHDLSETHKFGIDPLYIKRELEKKKYLVHLTYHWGNGIPCIKGMAPYVAIWAEK